ncbi:hypothetical protein Taro_054990, partial [Colocasia esculenta]|nr:hypothetical protein [Colocasia esculenta]
RRALGSIYTLSLDLDELSVGYSFCRISESLFKASVSLLCPWIPTWSTRWLYPNTYDTSRDRQAFTNPTRMQLQIAIQHHPNQLLSQFLIPNGNKDTWIWCSTANDTFSIKPTRSIHALADSQQWAVLWLPYIPLKWSILLWRLMLNIIPVDETMKRKGVPVASKCSCCTQSQEESALHLFFRSNIDNQIWSELFHLLNFSNREINDKIPQYWLATLHQNASVQENLQTRILSIIPWLTPPPGRLKLNVDGTFKMTSGEAGGGGILRDHEGKMCWAFARAYHGLKSSLAAEAVALIDDLSICCSKGITEVLVETDSLNLLQIVTK